MPELLKDFKIAPGTTCEVYTPNNDQIFLGKVSAYDGENLTIQERSGREVPSTIFNSSSTGQALTRRFSRAR